MPGCRGGGALFTRLVMKQSFASGPAQSGVALICGPFGKTCLFTTGQRSSLKTFCVKRDCVVTDEACPALRRWGGMMGARGDGRCIEREREAGERTGERGRLVSALSLPGLFPS